VNDNNKRWVKPIGRLLVGVLLFHALTPLSALAHDKPVVDPVAQRQLQQLVALDRKVEQAKAEKARGPAERVAQDFKQAQELVHSLKADSRARQGAATPGSAVQTRAVGPHMRIEVQDRFARLSDERRADALSQLEHHLRAIHDAQDGTRAEFAATGRELQRKKLPAEILARQDAAVAQFEQRAFEFEQLSQAWSASGSDAALGALDDFFKRYPAEREAAPFDAKKLPWSTPKPTTRVPATTKTAWFENLWSDHKVLLAQATNVGPIDFKIPPEPGQSPTTDDLAQTPETQQTAAITAKAAALGSNPVTIHNWVRNNVEWVPTWGAIQSAEDTLNKLRGNAHDIASLEIALLRASNIPARYQYGTIEVDADKMQNWVGGVSVPQAAQQLLGQGGIANRGVTFGGGIAHIQIEHVWVSAFVNWAPSRGAKQGTSSQHVNPNGPLNAWVSLDPSYKQYSYSAGMNLKAGVPIDANALLAAAQQGATINPAEGWVQNLNQAAVQSQLADYQTKLQVYIASQKADAKVGDAIGRKIIPLEVPNLLLGSLPYTVLQLGQQTAAVPSSLQHKFTYKLYGSLDDKEADSPLLAYTEKTSQLVGRRLTITYVPATQADADTVASYLPKPHADGTPIQPSEFSASLPGYLIKLKAQINLDGQVVATSSQALILGTDLYSTGGFTQLYDATQWDLTDEESNVAGNSTAIGISAQGISSNQLSAVRSRLAGTQAQVQSQNLTGLTGEQVVGDLLTATIWSWFAAAESNSRLSQNQAGVVENPGLSHGLFHSIANPLYSWGIISKVTFPGVNLDIGHVRNLTWSKNNNQQDWVNYNRLHGQYMSGIESARLDDFFNVQCNTPGAPSPDPSQQTCSQSVSTVKAIAWAGEQGQRIYTLTPEVYAANPDIVQAQLSGHSQETRDKVQSYLDAGYEISIHQSPITQDGWTGSGFSAIDPQTGAGAYLVDGKLNGGVKVAKGILTVLGIVLFFVGTGGVAPVLLTIIAILSIFVAFYSLLINAMALQDSSTKCGQLLADQYLEFFAPITAIASLLGLFGGSKTVESLIIKLVGIMYGADLYKGIGNAKVCQ
jgi:transglutaminase-like putative cysteine protease